MSASARASTAASPASRSTCPSSRGDSSTCHLLLLFVALLAVLGHHDLARLLRDLGVLLELHGELALALRGRAEVRRVAEHVVERHLGHRLHEALLLLGGDDGPAALI